ncbi:MAG: hypothetical protein KDA96_23980 [Planctomycetaceae bacterium]|nr:hypothetical protein [Planctomycetaceae bacterium]
MTRTGFSCPSTASMSALAILILVAEPFGVLVSTTHAQHVFRQTSVETLFDPSVRTANHQPQDATQLALASGTDEQRALEIPEPSDFQNSIEATPAPPGTSPGLPLNNDGPGCGGDRIRIAEPNDDDPDDENRVNFRQLMAAPYSIYRSEQNSLAWVPNSGEDLSWLDWQTDPYIRRDSSGGLTGAMNVHWIGGPLTPDIPSRVYDFSIGLQVRNSFSPIMSYDLATSVGVFSDFEGSAREGVRFPSHAVGMLHVNRNLDVVFGVDYLDRDDISLLPVAGVSVRNLITDRLRMDLVFPRPRIDFRLSDHNRVYLAGQLGGGTWDMEYPDETDDVVTYRDYRLLLGFESADSSGSLSALEFGYAFSRRMELRTLPAPLDFGDAFVIQWVSRK